MNLRLVDFIIYIIIIDQKRAEVNIFEEEIDLFYSVESYWYIHCLGIDVK